MPKVSIIIPVYNVEKYIVQCLDSVINQSLQDIEIIIVDDGSPDRCGEICEEYAKLDNRIKVIHKQNEGLGYARNSGISIASGEYIGFIDSDDFVEKNMFEELYNTAVKQKADAVYCGIYYHQNNESVASDFVNSISVWSGKNEVKKFLMDLVSSDIDEVEDARFGATVWKGIFSRKVIVENKIKFYSEREYVSEDSLFDIDFMSKAERVVMIPQNYYYYRYNPESLTSVYRDDRFAKNIELYKLGKQKLWENFHDQKIILQYGRMLISATRVCIIQEVRNTKKIGFKKVIADIRQMCSNVFLQEVLRDYPWEKLPVKTRIFSYLMKKRMAYLQFLFVTLKYRGK
ncbi:glycosyltransferase [Turicibacter bilis]|uniref:glycosyltransferase n=1 Tax=Turicibacter bilis TaxID=2735723 RepID=UPI001BAECB13|nr:glycosyltransferase [Turicibacter bilis]MBS3202812.1 glycosyltransferase [Turicibacter bilis]UUF11145.1 glycosyltransferase [Turicibacter bilis]